MKSTAIVILNWNGKKFLEDFLPAVVKHSSGLADIIIADNASTDGSVEWLADNMPGLQIIQNASNGGFAKGYNDALSLLDHRYFVLLNSDIEVHEGWLQPLISKLESNPEIFAVQPKILSWHKPTHFEYAGASGGYIDLFGFPFCRGRIFESLEEDQGQYDEAEEVFWATGACMAVRAKYFRELGGFDEEFFAHMEEIDLCWRAKSQGLSVQCEPASKVYHIGGGTLPKKSPFKTYLNFRNNLLLLYKNLPTLDFLFIILPKLILDGVAAIKFLTEGSVADFNAIIKAHLYFYKRLFRKQKALKRGSLYRMKGVFRGMIVVDHYLFRKNKFSDLASSRLTP